MVLILMMEVEVVVIVTREIVLIGCEQLCLFLELLIFHLESLFLVPLSLAATARLTSSTNMSDNATLLDKVLIFTGKMNIVADIRKFRDHCGNNLWGIIKGIRVAPVPFTASCDGCG
jgi:hypothetical protein